METKHDMCHDTIPTLGALDYISRLIVVEKHRQLKEKWKHFRRHAAPLSNEGRWTVRV